MPFRKTMINLRENATDGKECYHEKYKKIRLIPSLSQEKANDSELEFDINSEAILPLDLEAFNSIHDRCKDIRKEDGIQECLKYED